MKQNPDFTSESQKLLLATEELRKTKVELIKISRLYAFISQINQKIVRINDQETLFQNACDLALEFGKFQMAWIGIFVRKERSFSRVYQCGLPQINIHSFISKDNRYSESQDFVLTTGKHFISNDIKEVLDTQAENSNAEGSTIHSSIILPLKKEGIIIGTFNLYSTDFSFSNKEEIGLLMELTKDISFALDLFEKDKAHMEMKKEQIVSKKRIEESENRYRTFFENSIDGILLTVADGMILSVNPAACEMFRMSEQEICDSGRHGLIDSTDPRAGELISQRQMTGKAKGELTFLRKDGSKFAGEISSVLFQDSAGEKKTSMIIRDISERKAAERQKEFERNNLNALINNTNDLMWSVDCQYNLITSNIPFDESIRLMTSGSIIPKGSSVFLESFTEPQIKKYQAIYDRAFSGEAFSEFEHGESPNEHWLEISYYPIRNEDEVIGVACHSRNITKIKIAERLLQRSEAFSNGVLNSLSSHIAVLSQSGEIVAVNDSWKKFASENEGGTLNSLGVGNNYFNVCEKSASEGDESAFEALRGIKAVRDGELKDFYFEYPCHSPTDKRWFGMRVMKFDGVEQMIVLTHQNITERKSSEDSLFRSENRLREAQTIAHIGSWEIDLRSDIHIWSDEMYSIFGMEKDEREVSFELLLSFIHQEDHERVMEEVKAAMSDMNPSSSEFYFKAKDGRKKYGWAEWKFEFDSNCHPIRIYGILKDNTEAKSAELEREKMISEIIQHSKNLEQFAHIVSHNLRGPIVNILGLSNILKGETSKVDKQLIQQYIFTAVAQLDEVVIDLNKILQIKSEITKRKEEVSLRKLVEDIRSSIKSLIEKENVQIFFDFSAIGQIKTIKSYMHSIFYNLISNSIKYKHNVRSPVIRIAASLENGKIRISFKDNGSGIDLDLQKDKIFGLYKRFHENIEGKGFGLFMVKTQIEALGGNISVRSTPGEGTDFIVLLPV